MLKMWQRKNSKFVVGVPVTRKPDDDDDDDGRINFNVAYSPKTAS